MTVEDAKALLQKLGSKVVDLEERLFDYEDVEQQVAAEELPQAGVENRDAWSNLCTAFPSFVDSILSNEPSMHSPQFLEMSNAVQTRMIEGL